MKLRFAHLHPFNQLLWFIMLVLLGTFIAQLMTSAAAIAMFGSHAMSNFNVLMGNANFLRMAQVIQVFGMMFVPVLTFFSLFATDDDLLMFTRHGNAQVFVLAALIMVIGQPLVNWSAWINNQVVMWLPKNNVISWVDGKEKELADMTYQFLNTNSFGVMFINVIIMALLPAIFEELFFRGVIQQKLNQWWGNYHLAIVVTAIVFSAIHMQFVTFLPRFLLGMVLGYLLVWGKTIWLPMTAHFVNNFMGVGVFYYQKAQSPDFNPITVETVQADGWLALLSAATIVALLFVIRKQANGHMQKETAE